MDVPAAVAAMAAAVKAGDFAAADRLGREASCPLSIPKHALRLSAPISEGAQATVLAALYVPPAEDGGAGTGPPVPVAVKRPRIRESADLERFREEVALLAQLQHPGLVRLIGARLLPPDYCAVLELEATNAAAELHSAGWRPSWAATAALGAQVAAVLAHMHAAGVVHRDVKPANMLLDESRSRVRLADLGLAAPLDMLAAVTQTAKPSGGFHKQHMVGTLEYLAPEVLLGGRASCGSDVYALGITLAELGTGVVPFSDCTRDNPLAHTVLEMGYGRQELAAAVAAEGLRPILAPTTPAAVRALLEACWHSDPAARPTAAEVAAQLALLAEELAGQERQQAVERPGRQQQRSAGLEWEGPALSRDRSPSSVLRSPAAAFCAPKGAADGEDCFLSRDSSFASLAASEDEEVGLMGSSTPATSPSLAPLTPEQPRRGNGRWGGAAPPAWLAASLEQQGASISGAPTLHLSAPSVGAFASAGARGVDRMEDRHLLLRDLGGWEGVTLLGAFDGHRGAEAAAYLAEHLEGHLAARWGGAASATELLADALADADAAFRAQQDASWAQRVAAVGPEAAGRRAFPGTTACVALLAGSLLAVANLGDSRAVLCRAGQALPLTQDQTADRLDERARIASGGGQLRHVAGSWRVGEAGLQVTRSVGDGDVKQDGVSAEAEVVQIGLDPSADTFLVLATDGVWDQLSSGDAVALVADTVKQPTMCAQRLVTEALARGSRDNLTALVAVLPFNGIATTERVFLAAGAARHVAQGGRKAGALPTFSTDELATTY